MRVTESRHGPGCVGVISADDQVRYHHLLLSLDSLQVPNGSKLLFANSCNAARNTNNLVKLMLEDPAMEWLWIMGDDHCFESDTLMRLLDHEKDCIMPLTPRRVFPHDSVIWKEFIPEEGVTVWYTWEEISAFKEPFPVAAGGTAGLLVKRRVFERMRSPWFQLAKFFPDDMQEDVYFTWKANLMGHTVFCDPSIPMGHITNAVMFPKRGADGQIGVAANLNGFRQWVVPPGYTAKRDENGDSVYRRQDPKAVT